MEKYCHRMPGDKDGDANEVDSIRENCWEETE